MNISIDGKNIDSAAFDGANLEEVLAALQTHDLLSDRVIGEVLLNGESYSEDIPHAAVEVPRERIESLQIITRTSEEIALHFLKHGRHFIDSLLGATPKIVEMFRLGDEAEANEHFLRYLESLHLLAAMLSHVVAAVDVNVDDRPGGRKSLAVRLENISKILTEMIPTQEQADWIYLADLLEYELTAELEALNELVPHLADERH